MKQLFPATTDNIDPLVAYELPDENKNHLRINMVSSIDGQVVVDGKSKPLSSDDDRQVFHALRALSDVVLVGAGTMRIENYGPVVMSENTQTHRRSHGRAEIPPIAVVTRSGMFDVDSSFFQKAQSQPIILTTDHGARNASSVNEYADVISCGEKEVDLKVAVDELNKRGLMHILCEGGPSLNADLLHAGVVDELCLTIAPVVVAKPSKTIFDDADLDSPARMEFTHVLQYGDDVFLRIKVV